MASPWPLNFAAARLPTVGLDELVAGLSDHLRLLVGRRRADERHSSLRAMLDWSAGLLTDADLTVFRRITVFVTPFTVEAAVEVVEFRPWRDRTPSPTAWPASLSRAF